MQLTQRTLLIMLAGVTLTVFIFINKGCFIGIEQKEANIEQVSATVPQVGLRIPALDDQFNPTPPLLNLLQIMGITHNGTLQSIVDTTQREWLRPTGVERWQMQERFAQKKDEVLPLLEQMGFIDEVFPKQTTYEYALVLGATVNPVRGRLAYLIDLWKKGIRFNSIVGLAGDRPLDSSRESEQMLLDAHNTILPFKAGWQLNGSLPTTEAGMMELVFDQTDFPDEMKNLPIKVIHTPLQKRDDGTMRNPNTVDIAKEWLKTNPKSGSCLAVSCQPYVLTQNLALTLTFPPKFNIETVGRKDSKSGKVDVYLDNLARYLYQENQRKNA